MVFLSIDFSEAYDGVFHSYLEAFFRYIALPLPPPPLCKPPPLAIPPPTRETVTSMFF